jgi:hypothetical protein
MEKRGFKVDTQSLHTIMNRIAAHPDMVADNAVEPESAPRDLPRDNGFDLSDITPFLGTDPVILDLAKIYLNAKADYHAALLTHGRDSPIVDIAGDHLDSSWCALQSRLYELKEDMAAAARAQTLAKIEKNAFEAREEERRKKEKESLKLAAENTRERTGQNERDSRYDNLWLFIIYIMSARDPWRFFGDLFAGPALMTPHAVQ